MHWTENTHKDREVEVQKHFKTYTDCSEITVVYIKEHNWKDLMEES